MKKRIWYPPWDGWRIMPEAASFQN